MVTGRAIRDGVESGDGSKELGRETSCALDGFDRLHKKSGKSDFLDEKLRWQLLMRFFWKMGRICGEWREGFLLLQERNGRNDAQLVKKGKNGAVVHCDKICF